MQSLQLENVGNTCYFNSALQIYLRLQQKRKKQEAIEEGQKYDPSKILELLRQKSGFVANQQHDAHEAFVALIELSKSLEKQCTGVQDNVTQCTLCNTANVTKAEFNTLFMPCTGNFVTDLKLFFQTTTVDDYQCDKCQCSCKAVISTKLSKLPSYLTIKTTSQGIPASFDILNYTYTLIGVCCYYGNSKRGHYNCYVKYGDQWMFKDDEVSTPVDSPKLNHICFVVYYLKKRSS